MKKSHRIWLSILVVGAFFVFFSGLALDRTLNSTLLRSLIQDKIGTLFNLTISYRSVQVSFIPLGVQLHDIEVHSDNDIEFSAKRATADLSWWSLFMGTPKIGNFRLEQPTVHRTWQANKPQTTKPSNANSVWHWPRWYNNKIEQITIIDPDLHLDYTNTANSRQIFTLRGGELVINMQTVDVVTVSLHIAALDYRYNDKQWLQDVSLTGTGKLGTQGFTFTLNSLSGKNIEQLRGTINGYTTVDAQQVMTAPLQVQGKLSLRGDLALLNISRSSGRSSTDFNIKMRFAPQRAVTFTATGRVKVEQGLLGGIKLHDSEAHLTVTPKQLRFRNGKLVIAGEPRGTFRGWLNFAAPLAFDFSGSIKRLAFAELMSTFNTKLDLFNFDLASKQLRVYGRGKPFSLTVQANTTLTALQISKQHNHHPPPACAVQFDIHSDNKRLTFKNLQGRCPATRDDANPIVMHGTIAYKTRQIDLKVKADKLDLSTVNFLLAPKVAGQATLMTTIKGAGNAVVVSNTVDLQQLHLATKAIGAATAQLDFRRDSVSWRQLRWRPAHGGEVVSSQGELNYADLQFNLQVKANNVKATDLQPLLAQVNAPLHFGVARLSASLAGFLPHPLAYRGKLQAKLQQLKTADEKLADELDFTAQTSKRGWHLTLHRLRRATLLLQGDVKHQRQVAFQRQQFATATALLTRLGLHARDELQINLTAQQTDEQVQRLPYLGKHFAARFVAAELKLVGAVQRLHGILQAKLAAINLAGLQLGTVRIISEVDAGKLDARLFNTNRSLRGELQVDLGAAQLPFAWQLVFDAFDIRQLIAGNRNEHNQLRLNGRWDLRGRLRQWFSSSGELALNTLQLHRSATTTTEQPFQLQLQKPIRILFKAGKIRVFDDEEIVFRHNDTRLVVLLRPECSLRQPTLDFSGVVNAAVLPHFLTEVDVATGFLQLEGELRWQRHRPQLNLQMERLSPLAVSIAGLRPAFNDIDIKLNYRDGVLVIERLQGRSGEGEIIVRGEIYSRHTGQSFLQISLQDAYFIHPVLGFENTELHLDGNLAIRWRELPLDLNGTLTVRKASNFSDFDIRKVILASIGTNKYRTRALTHKPTVNFDLNIVADRSLTIENRNMQAELSARLHLQGSNNAPRLNGFVKIEQGRFIYRRSFTLTQGMISFAGGQRLNPRLDIRAYSEVSPYVVDLLISGTAAEPVGELTITPALRDDGTAISKADIIMLLSRGTLPELDKTLSDTGIAGFSELTNVLVGQFEQPLEHLLKHSGQNVINRIFIDTYATQQGVLYPKLTAPINLPWRDWDLSLQVDPYMWKLLTEYPIHDSITLSGSISGRSRDEEEKLATQDSANDQAIDLKFRFSIP